MEFDLNVTFSKEVESVQPIKMMSKVRPMEDADSSHENNHDEKLDAKKVIKRKQGRKGIVSWLFAVSLKDLKHLFKWLKVIVILKLVAGKGNNNRCIEIHGFSMVTNVSDALIIPNVTIDRTNTDCPQDVPLSVIWEKGPRMITNKNHSYDNKKYVPKKTQNSYALWIKNFTEEDKSALYYYRQGFEEKKKVNLGNLKKLDLHHDVEVEEMMGKILVTIAAEYPVQPNFVIELQSNNVPCEVTEVSNNRSAKIYEIKPQKEFMACNKSLDVNYFVFGLYYRTFVNYGCNRPGSNGSEDVVGANESQNPMIENENTSSMNSSGAEEHMLRNHY